MSRKASRNSQGSPRSRKWTANPERTLRQLSGRGVKCLDGGSQRMNRIAAISATMPMVASVQRHGTQSTMTPLIRRPLMPPIELPLM